MNIDVSHGRAGIWIAACLWLAPSANCNILTHWGAGGMGELITQSLFVVAMACLPIIAKRYACRRRTANA